MLYYDKPYPLCEIIANFVAPKRKAMKQNHFNTYKQELDLEFLKQYCMEHGEVRTFEQGEAMEKEGETSQWVAYVDSGYFKYMVHNSMGGIERCTGFAFEGEFVANYPFCLNGDLSELTIEAGMPCRVIMIDGKELQHMYDEDTETMRKGMQIIQNLFKMVYDRYLDFYRYSAFERYSKLLSRCPQVVQMLPLKDIASFLNITPSYLSTIRTKITFGEDLNGEI